MLVGKAELMVRARTYSDDALADAVAASTSWRGVLRALGLVATSAATDTARKRRSPDGSISSSGLFRRDDRI
jgi:hypothetical protein